MALKEYEVQISGVPHTLQLSDEDASRYGDAAKLVKRKAATAPANKSGAPGGNSSATANTK